MISFNPLKNKIYLDMDGVLADFDAFVFAHLGRTFLHEEGPGKDTEMWEFLITVSNMYYRLLPTSYAQELVAAARALTENVEILTAIPRRYHIHGAETDKIEWTKLHFGNSLKVNFGPYSADKWKHAQPGDILVDDRRDNIKDWTEKAGGIGIFHDHKNPQETFRRLEDIRKYVNCTDCGYVKSETGKCACNSMS